MTTGQKIGGYAIGTIGGILAGLIASAFILIVFRPNEKYLFPIIITTVIIFVIVTLFIMNKDIQNS